MLADIDKASADLVAEEIVASGGEARSLMVDVVDKDQVQVLAETVRA